MQIPPAPELSVILPTADNYSTIRRTVNALRAQTVQDRIELVIVGPTDDPGLIQSEVAGFASVRVVNAGTLRTSNSYRAAGIRVAAAPIVALAEDHCFPDPDWAEALIEAHRGEWAVVGPVLRNANPRSMTSWANLLLEYYPWLEGAERAELNDLPGHNSAYRKDLLLAYGDRLEELFEVEAVIQRELRENGHRMLLEPAAHTNHLNFSRISSAMQLRFRRTLVCRTQDDGLEPGKASGIRSWISVDTAGSPGSNSRDGSLVSDILAALSQSDADADARVARGRVRRARRLREWPRRCCARPRIDRIRSSALHGRGGPAGIFGRARSARLASKAGRISRPGDGGMKTGSKAAPTTRFSVIVATYQRPDELSRCVRAIGKLNHPRDRFEVIVVNDGGIVHNPVQLKSLAGDVDFRIMTTINAGPGAARNAGAAVARGQFLTFVDDDCVPSPDWLQRLSAAVDRSHDAMIGGQTVNVLKRNLFSQASQTLVDYVYAYYNERGAKRNEFFASNNMTLSANAFHAIGGFDESFRTAEDRELCKRWGAGGGRFEYVPDIVIGHGHRLGPFSFLRQHFGYGRGALPYWRKSGANGVRGIRVEPFSFYLGMLSFPFKRRERYASILAGLVLVSQISNAYGFAYEGLRRLFERERVPLIAREAESAVNPSS